MSFDKLNDAVYNRWYKDDCENVIIEIFWYEIYDKMMRTILEMDDEKITKQSILEIADQFINDPQIISDARMLSNCFEERD